MRRTDVRDTLREIVEIRKQGRDDEVRRAGLPTFADLEGGGEQVDPENPQTIRVHAHRVMGAAQMPGMVTIDLNKCARCHGVVERGDSEAHEEWCWRVTRLIEQMS